MSPEAQMPLQCVPVFGVVISDYRYRRGFSRRGTKNLTRMIFNQAAGLVYLPVAEHAAVMIERPGLPAKRVGESEIHRPYARPIRRDFEPVDEMDGRIPDDGIHHLGTRRPRL